MNADDSAIDAAPLTFVPPQKPAALRAAEAALRKARADRDEVHVRLVQAAADQKSTTSATMTSINRDLDAAEGRVKACRADVATQCEALEPAYFKSIRNLTAEAAVGLLTALDEIDRVTAALAEAEKFAAANRLRTPQVIARARMLRRLSSEFRQVAGAAFQKAP